MPYVHTYLDSSRHPPQSPILTHGSQGYTRFSTFADLHAPTAEDWDKTFAINVKAQTYLCREAMPIFNRNAEGGVMIITSSIAGAYAGGSSMPYSVSKAAQLHLMKCLSVTQGPKLRVNAILPGLLLTEWVSACLVVFALGLGPFSFGV
jgi:NAD(P)-dependent dehydrogenase (short-subunit alcohol dehydrogenase family)